MKSPDIASRLDPQGAEPDADGAAVSSALPADFVAGGGDEVAARHPSIGKYLAGQRQLRGISQEELCERTRIPMRSLERLESGQFDDIDDGFVRGFVRTVSEGLGIDADDAVARMVVEPVPESPREVVGRSLVRAGLGLAAIVVLLLSAGLINMAMELDPVESDSPVVLRRDPVRALARAEGMLGVPETALWAPVRGAGEPDTAVGEALLGEPLDLDLGPGPESPPAASRPENLAEAAAGAAVATPARATARVDDAGAIESE